MTQATGTAATVSDLSVWPLAGLRLRCGPAILRLARESDFARLAAVVPPDWEQDPRAERLAGLSPIADRRRLVYQDLWRALGTWSPASWRLHLAVEDASTAGARTEDAGTVVGVQSLEADQFPALRTVDSGSWLIPQVRGRGLGVAMRRAVLGLAFDHLGAVAAVTSAAADNAASLGVSRRTGYAPNGVSLVDSGRGPLLLRHLRLTAEQWHDSGQSREVTVTGLEPCRPWFGLG